MVSSAPVTSYAVERATLRNGLRVVLAPDRSAPVVAVAVYYDVGIRSEPEGRTGFAHLFEHLMFQGSANLEKMEHVQLRAGLRRHVQRLDPPGLHQLLRGAAVQRPGARAVPRGRPDARAAPDRGEPRQPDRRGQGGDPGQRPQPALRRVPVADPAAGAVRHVPQRPQRLRRVRRPGERHGRRRRATSSTATTPPATRCSPSAGDLDAGRRRMELVERHFGDVPPAHAPDAARLRRAGARPRSGAATHADPLAPLPAVALGWRVPDPVDDLDAYLPYVVLAEVLADGDAVPAGAAAGAGATASATDVGGYLGFMGDPFDVRDPTAAASSRRTTRPTATADRVLAAVDEELDRLATDGARRRTSWSGSGPGSASALLRGRTTCSAADAGDGVVRAAARPGRAASASCPACSARSPTSRSRAAAADAAAGRAGPRSRSSPEVPGEPPRRKARRRPATVPGAWPGRASCGCRRWPSGRCPTACGWSPCAGRRAAGRGPAAGAVRRAAAEDHRPRARAAGQRHAARHRRALRRSSSPRRCRSSAASCRVGARPRPADRRRRRRCAAGLRRRCCGCSPRCSTGASYPRREVEGERARLAERARRSCARSRPCWPARRCCGRMYGEHPYGREHADAGRGARGAAGVAARAARAAGSCPDGAVLRAGRRPHAGPGARPRWSGAGGWTGRRPDAGAGGCRPAQPGPLLLVDRPGVGAVHRCGWAGPRAARTDPTTPRCSWPTCLRRLLLLPAGREHPRGQGLHLRPAQCAVEHRAAGSCW